MIHVREPRPVAVLGVVLAVALLLGAAGCGAPHPPGTVRARSAPWTGVAAYCWPLEGGPDLSFRWLVAGVRPPRAGTSTPRTVTVQVLGTDADAVAADLDRALPRSGWRRPAGSWPVGTSARFTGTAGRTVGVRVEPLVGAGPGSPVTAVVRLDLPPGVALSRQRPPCPGRSAAR